MEDSPQIFQNILATNNLPYKYLRGKKGSQRDRRPNIKYLVYPTPTQGRSTRSTAWITDKGTQLSRILITMHIMNKSKHYSSSFWKYVIRMAIFP